MTRTPTRRQYLATSSAAGIAAIAGCSDVIEDYEEAEETPEENSSENNSSEADDDPVENVDYENPEGELQLVQPEDGAQVENPVTFEMEVENFELQPAGDGQNDETNETNETDGSGESANSDSGAAEGGAGHLHVIVDEECVDPGYVIPEEDGYHHLGDGESETEIELEPGEHDICAQAGDDQHNAYEMSDEITIEVVEGGGGGNETDEGGGNETDEGDANETEE